MPDPEQDSFVYTITVLDVRNTDCPAFWRPLAAFLHLEDAIFAVRNNELDISEAGTNQYAIVEKTRLDEVYPIAKERHWFEWDPVEEEYIEADIPEKYVRVYSFGIG